MEVVSLLNALFIQCEEGLRLKNMMMLEKHILFSSYLCDKTGGWSESLSPDKSRKYPKSPKTPVFLISHLIL